MNCRLLIHKRNQWPASFKNLKRKYYNSFHCQDKLLQRKKFIYTGKSSGYIKLYPNINSQLKIF